MDRYNYIDKLPRTYTSKDLITMSDLPGSTCPSNSTSSTNYYVQPQPMSGNYYIQPSPTYYPPQQQSMYRTYMYGYGEIKHPEPTPPDVFKNLPLHLRHLGREGAAKVIAEDDGSFIDFLDAIKIERVRMGL